MDVTIGVTVKGPAAQVALLDAAPPHPMIDQSEIVLADEPVATLASTLVSTDRMLAESGHRLVGTSVCVSDQDLGTRLRDALVDADLTNVTVVSLSDAMTAVTRSVVGDETAASMVSDGETAALSIVDTAADTTSLIAVEPVSDGDVATAYRTLLERFSEEPGGATSVVVVGAPLDAEATTDLNATSPVPVRYPENPEFALARGAAVAGSAPRRANPASQDHPEDSLDAADTMLAAAPQQLAYSQMDDADDFGLAGAAVPMQTPMQPLSAVDPDEYESETEDDDAAPNRPRVLLLGSTVAAVVIVGFAALAVSVAINIRPATSEQAVRMDREALAGRYFPVAPGQGVNPSGPNWTLIEEVPPPGTEPDARTFRTQSLGSSPEVAEAGREVIKFFRDGTIGVVPPNVPVSPPPPPGVPGPVGVPDSSIFLTRLIPDFSRWNPCQVLALVANMRLMTEAAMGAATDVGTSAIESLGNVTGGLTDIDEVGEIAVVSADKGNLFATPEASTATTDLDAIPEQIFKTGAVDPDVSSVLPEDVKIVDTKVIESLPADDGLETVSSVPILGKPIPEVVERSLEGVQGTAPTGDVPVVDVSTSIPDTGESVPDTKFGIPGGKPGMPAPDRSGPGVDIPNVPPPADSGLELPKPQLPVIEVPAPPPVQAPEPPRVIEAPAPPPVEMPKPQAPVIEVPKPQAPVEVPKPQAPVIEVPAPPPVEVPKPPPVIEAPAPPPVQVPKAPVIELPTKLPIPTQVIPAPAPKAPSAPKTPSAPKLPSLPLPTMLPEFGGGLFGSGSGS